MGRGRANRLRGLSCALLACAAAVALDGTPAAACVRGMRVVAGAPGTGVMTVSFRMRGPWPERGSTPADAGGDGRFRLVVCGPDGRVHWVSDWMDAPRLGRRERAQVICEIRPFDAAIPLGGLVSIEAANGALLGRRSWRQRSSAAPGTNSPAPGVEGRFPVARASPQELEVALATGSPTLVSWGGLRERFRARDPGLESVGADSLRGTVHDSLPDRALRRPLPAPCYEPRLSGSLLRDKGGRR